MSENSNALRLALFTVAIYIAAQTVGNPLLYYLAYVLAAVLIAAFIWARVSRRALSLSRSVRPTQAQVGRYVWETIELSNLSWLRKLWLEVRDRSTLPGHYINAVVSLRGGQTKRWRVRTRCARRGLYRLGPTEVVTGDPFGLFQFSRTFTDSAELLVLPPTVPLASFGLPSGELPGGTKTERRAYHSTPNASGIRDYLPGDPMHRIHWPVSARAQKLMVKEFELDPTADLWLVLDLNEDVHVAAEEWERASTASPALPRDIPPQPVAGAAALPEDPTLTLEPSTEEYAIAVTASLAGYFISQGKSVGLVAWGQYKATLPADRGGRQFMKILRALAVLRAEGDIPLGEVLTTEAREFGRQDTLVVVTPSMDDDWAAALQLQLYKVASAAAVLIEQSTFGGEGSPLMLVSALSAMNVPSYLVKRGDPIDTALSQEYAPAGIRNLR